MELKNGELISGGDDGSLRRWKDGKAVGDGKPIATGQGEVLSLVELKNGELISGGSDGTLRRWREHSSLLSPQKLVKIVCKEELPEILKSAETIPEKEGAALCKRLGYLR